MARPKVGEILLRAGLIDEMQLRAALADQNNWGRRLGSTLVRMGVLEEHDLVRALAQQLELPVVGLEGKRVQPDVLELVPIDLAEKHLCVPLFVKEHHGRRTLYVGMDDPTDLEAVDALAFRSGLAVQPVLVSPSELCEAIDRLYHRRGERGIDFDPDDAEPASEALRAGVDEAPRVQESLFREVGGEIDPASEATPTQPDAARAGADDAAHHTILRALCQLLIEKRVIARDELQALVRSLQQPDRDA